MSDHYLVVEEDGDETAWYIEHPDDCPTRVVWAGDAESGHPDVMGHACAYDYEVENAGADCFDGPMPTEVGRYLVEHWHTVSRGFDWTEHNTGVHIHLDHPARRIQSDEMTRTNARNLAVVYTGLGAAQFLLAIVAAAVHAWILLACLVVLFLWCLYAASVYWENS